MFWRSKDLQAIGRKLDRLSEQMDALIKQGNQIMAKADDARTILTKLTADVTSQKTVIGGMNVLLTNLGAIIKDLNDRIKTADNIPQDIIDAAQAADDAVNQNTAAIADAVTANTPQA